MFSFKPRNQFNFGSVSIKDDRDIEVIKLRRVARQAFWFEALRFVRDIILIIAVFILFLVFVAQPVVVEGNSMTPVLRSGERLIVSKLVYYDVKSFSWGHIERGNIVVFWYPQDPSKSFVKRIIGLPGEEVEIQNGQVFIDGKILQEPYLNAEENRSLLSYEPKQVDAHHYFVMGDNRDNSLDSRFWGLVPKKYIYGKVFFRFWKLSNLGFLERTHPKLKETENDQYTEDKDDYLAKD